MSDETRIELDSWDANRDAALKVAQCARRQLNMLTYDFEPQIYNEEAFVEAVTAVATSGRFARVRILVQDSKRAVREGHMMIELARRLSSFISIHRPHTADAKIIESYLVADEVALLYRTQADRYEGFADTNDPFEARQHLRRFEEIWGRSSPDPEMRRLGI